MKTKSADPAAAFIAFGKGTELEGRKEYHLAIAAFTEALLFDERNADALLHRGYCLWQIGDRVQAAADFRRSLAMKSTGGGVTVGAALNLDFDKLSKDNLTLEDLVQDPQSGETGKDRPLQGRLFKNPESANAATTRPAITQPKETEAAPVSDNPVSVLDGSEAQRAEAARKAIEKILQARKSDRPASPEPVVTELPAIPQPTVVPVPPAPIEVAVLVPADRAQPDRSSASDAGYYLRIARLHANALRFPLAIQAYNQALALNPGMAPAFNGRGYAYLRTNQVDRAITDFSDALRLDPNYVNAYQNRSVARRLAGDVPGAAEDSLQANTARKAPANQPNPSLAKRRGPQVEPAPVPGHNVKLRL